MRASTFAWIVLAATLATAGCGNLTAGGVGEVSVSVTGDAPGSGLAFAEGGATLTPSLSTVSGAPGPALTSHDDDEPEGEVEAEFLLYLVSESGNALRLGNEPARLRLDLRGRNELRAVESVPVPATRYTELQVLFLELEAEVDSGLVVQGDTITGLVDVEFEGENLLVARSLDVTVDDGARVDLVIDLNAPAWLQAVDPITSTVDQAAVAALVAVVVR